MKAHIEDTSIVFIGAGNLATNLASALYHAGFGIAQVYSRTQESAQLLANKVSTKCTTDLHGVTKQADLYIVSLTDSALMQLLPAIVAGKPNALLVHTAGSVSIDVWKGHANRYGVLYPMQTFSKQREVDFGKVPFFIEATTEKDTTLLKAIASTLSEHVYVATSEQRQNLHLSAVFANNFTNHMYALSAELLKKHHLPFDVMLPLIDETARKAHQVEPHSAQTGPAVRYDEEIINKHLSMLCDTPDTQQLYELISKSIFHHKQ